MNASVQESLRGLGARPSRCKGIGQSEDSPAGGFRVMGESLQNLFPRAPSLFGFEEGVFERKGEGERVRNVDEKHQSAAYCTPCTGDVPATKKMNSSSSTMNEEPDALSVVNQLRDLAADPLNRRAIVQDQGCLPGLILFMDHPNPPVVHSALLALRYLAECRANREKMKGELGMMLSLQNVIQKTTTPGETKLLASEIYDILQSSNMADGDSFNEMNSRRRKAQFFLGTTNKRAKTVVLHIDGLDDTSRRNLCEEALLKIKGVISFTFQMAVQRCVVRIRSDLKAEALASAIASTKVMKAQQVVKSESGEEMLVPFQDMVVEVEQNTELPDYLPEDESPTKEQDKAVSRVGSHPEGGASWLSTAANFLSRSFYWSYRAVKATVTAFFEIYCKVIKDPGHRAICNNESVICKLTEQPNNGMTGLPSGRSRGCEGLLLLEFCASGLQDGKAEQPPSFGI
ncbi:hypothetical protein QTO34_007732 [Cnephaeus nilssonii]|nr:hypothetical protein QTO34_007732 [Eptesicus nilssonii]